MRPARRWSRAAPSRTRSPRTRSSRSPTRPAGAPTQPTMAWDAIDARPEDLVVIVGAGEVGPLGSSRTRIELEVEDRLSAGRRARAGLEHRPDRLGAAARRRLARRRERRAADRGRGGREVRRAARGQRRHPPLPRRRPDDRQHRAAGGAGLPRGGHLVRRTHQGRGGRLRRGRPEAHPHRGRPRTATGRSPGWPAARSACRAGSSFALRRRPGARRVRPGGLGPRLDDRVGRPARRLEPRRHDRRVRLERLRAGRAAALDPPDEVRQHPGHRHRRDAVHPQDVRRRAARRARLPTTCSRRRCPT